MTTRRQRRRPDWRAIAGYGAVLAAGTTALQLIDYWWIARRASTELYLALLAAGFLTLGLYVGWRVGRPAPVAHPPGNPAAQQALGISPRELLVLQQLAAGGTNKEIARALGVSPNTIKTHVARLFERLEVRRRTEAIARARELGLL